MGGPSFEPGLPTGSLTVVVRRIPELHRWYRANARAFPWRRTRDPYAIWVSEVMLQQTRADTVVPYYERWMAALPDVHSLASASEERVLSLWEGLGYYHRARNLRRAAREVVGRHGGRIPDDPAAFRALPGVGEYTAAAVLSIAFGRDLAVVDGNVRRVLCRIFTLDGAGNSGSGRRLLHRLAAELLPRGKAALHNQAMMELGAAVCTPRSPSCQACPLEPVCRARAAGCPEAFPRPSPRRPLPHHHVAVGIVERGGQVLIARRPSYGLLGGLWEFPGGKLEPGETPEEALHRELLEELGLRVRVEGTLGPVGHAYSHFRVTLYPFLCRFAAMDAAAAEGREWKWVRPAELHRYPMPRANRKILEQWRAFPAPPS